MDALRWAVSQKERGEHVVFYNAEDNLYAVGWNDHHYKCYITTHGVTEPGEEAKKKRQRQSGRNYQITVQRPDAIARYQNNMGGICRQAGIGMKCWDHLENEALAD
jgi:hypothetical protein